MAGETVSKHVRGDVLEQAAAAAVALDEHPQGDAVQRLAGAGDEEAIGAMVIDPRAAIA
jgi:hypothetical protein